MASGRYPGGRGGGIPLAAKVEVLRRRAAGETWAGIGAAVGISSASIGVIVQEAGGMRPRGTGCRDGQLTLEDRVEINAALAADRKVSLAAIGARLDKHRSTIWAGGDDQRWP